MDNKINKVLVLSYYHPWVSGGGHRPHQLALEDLLRGKEVAFIYSNNESSSDIDFYIDRKEYKNLHLYHYSNKKIKSINSPKPPIAIEKFTLDFQPDYVRAHNPVETFLDYIEFLNNNKICFLYDQMDDWESFAAQPWGATKVEKKYIESANLISTITDKLASSISGKKLLVLPNAIKDDLINVSVDNRETYTTNPKKTVIYAGAMWPDWFDWDLSFYLVEKFLEYQFTFIGETKAPQDEDYGLDTEKLSKNLSNFPNVELSPQVPHNSLVNFFSRSHVGIIPFKVNRLTLSCSPLKAFDYLASGLPIVSSSLTQLKDYPFFYYGDNYFEISEKLRAADKRGLTPEDFGVLSSFIRKNTWRHRINELDSFIINNSCNSEIERKK